jgi:hypothetical protein
VSNEHVIVTEEERAARFALKRSLINQGEVVERESLAIASALSEGIVLIKPNTEPVA